MSLTVTTIRPVGPRSASGKARMARVRGSGKTRVQLPATGARVAAACSARAVTWGTPSTRLAGSPGRRASGSPNQDRAAGLATSSRPAPSSSSTPSSSASRI
jgi:hypothetical protein